MMICPPELRPELEIPDSVWAALSQNEFVNFAVPLLSPPVEFEDRVFWSGVELMKVSASTAAFPRLEDASMMMPYGEMFSIVDGPGVQAQIYSVFFERCAGEWRMVYRLMNVDRMLRRDASAMPGWADDGLPTSSWSLSSTEVCEWLTMRELADHFCPLAGLSGALVEACIERVLASSGSPQSASARMLPLNDGRCVVVPTTASPCCAMLIDLRTGRSVSRLVMNDPTYIVERFWSLTGKIFITRRESAMLDAIASESRHFAAALSEARERVGAMQELTAAAFCF